MGLSEKVQLLGAGLYTDIPDVLTLSSIPTVSELDYVGNEDFDKTMLDSILPKAVEEKINFRDLLEIDYEWICRCLRILNYGPYFTTNMVLCPTCKDAVRGREQQVDLQTIDCKPLPAGFTNDITIPAGAFIDYKQDVHMHLMTIARVIEMNNDKSFKLADGGVNSRLARACYCITSIGNHTHMTPVEVKLELSKNFSPADYLILADEVGRLSDYGLRAAGRCACPVCGNKEAAYLALSSDRFFRPSVGDLRAWGQARGERGMEDLRRYTASAVQKHS
ncbi:hypothetical protein [uncultured Duncaniella sp.]|uniref:hypothetical protein n=1 Tax=uncultured Duncaniella sp. TaxID=2768039 RepID=UPI00261F4E34|nr:hypothetical protein [uncultured Duncaniella sp.]